FIKVCRDNQHRPLKPLLSNRGQGQCARTPLAGGRSMTLVGQPLTKLRDNRGLCEGLEERLQRLAGWAHGKNSPGQKRTLVRMRILVVVCDSIHGDGETASVDT